VSFFEEMVAQIEAGEMHEPHRLLDAGAPGAPVYGGVMYLLTPEPGRGLHGRRFVLDDMPPTKTYDAACATWIDDWALMAHSPIKSDDIRQSLHESSCDEEFDGLPVHRNLIRRVLELYGSVNPVGWVGTTTMTNRPFVAAYHGDYLVACIAPMERGGSGNGQVLREERFWPLAAWASKDAPGRSEAEAEVRGLLREAGIG
jgi:hypothetical protein